jgi:histidyl-tRNA synthetase
LHDKWKCTSRQFGFEQIDTPIVEYGDMYDRNLLEDINQQIYTFKDSSKGHPMQLRAEMTPSLVRAVVAHHPKATYPLKWFSIPQCWSHDVSGAQTDVSTCEGNNTAGSDALMRYF